MVLKLIPRAQWGARPPKNKSWGKLLKESTAHWQGNLLTVHGKKEWEHSRCAQLVRGIQNFHMDTRGYSDIGYNFIVCPHGYTFECRGLNVINAANGTNTGNRSSHAICALSGEGNPFKMDEKIGFRATVKHIAEKTGAIDRCIGHRDHKATACPGDERYAWVRAGMPVSKQSDSKTGGSIVNGANRSQGGFALVSPDGGVFCYEDAPFLDSLPSLGVTPNAPIVGLAWNIDGTGYWLVGADGGVYCFGVAEFRGSYPGLAEEARNDPKRRFVAIVTRRNGGYVLVSSTQELYHF